MNRPARTRTNRRRQGPNRGGTPDLWRTVRPLPEFHPIVSSRDPGALLRSLGDPPITRGGMAGNYFDAVVQRAAAVAIALALSADVLAHDDAESD